MHHTHDGRRYPNDVPALRRYVSWRAAALSVTLFIAACLILLAALTATTSPRSRGTALLLGLCVGVGAVAVAMAAFPKGCGQCGVRFVEAGRTFTDGAHDALWHALTQGDPRTIMAWEPAPSATGEGPWTSLQVDHCPCCAKVAQVTVRTMRHGANLSETVRSNGPQVLSYRNVGPVLALIDATKGPATPVMT